MNKDLIIDKHIKINKTDQNYLSDIYLKNIENKINKNFIYEKKIISLEKLYNKFQNNYNQYGQKYYLSIIILLFFTVAFIIYYNLLIISLCTIIFLLLISINKIVGSKNRKIHQRIIDIQRKYKKKISTNIVYNKEIDINIKKILEQIKNVVVYNKNYRKYTFEFRQSKILPSKEDSLNFALQPYLIFLFDKFLVRYDYTRKKIKIYEYKYVEIEYFDDMQELEYLHQHNIYDIHIKKYYQKYLYPRVDGGPDMRYTYNPLLIYYVFHGIKIRFTDFELIFIAEYIETLKLFDILFKNEKL